jgi:hypothetical protein
MKKMIVLLNLMLFLASCQHGVNRDDYYSNNLPTTANETSSPTPVNQTPVYQPSFPQDCDRRDYADQCIEKARKIWTEDKFAEFKFGLELVKNLCLQKINNNDSCYLSGYFSGYLGDKKEETAYLITGCESASPSTDDMKNKSSCFLLEFRKCENKDLDSCRKTSYIWHNKSQDEFKNNNIEQSTKFAEYAYQTALYHCKQKDDLSCSIINDVAFDDFYDRKNIAAARSKALIVCNISKKSCPLIMVTLEEKLGDRKSARQYAEEICFQSESSQWKAFACKRYSDFLKEEKKIALSKKYFDNYLKIGKKACLEGNKIVCEELEKENKWVNVKYSH